MLAGVNNSIACHKKYKNVKLVQCIVLLSVNSTFSHASNLYWNSNIRKIGYLAEYEFEQNIR